MMLICYPSKKALKASIGQKLTYRETSASGIEYKADGDFTAAYRPAIWKHVEGGREFFARITMANGLIAKVD